MRKIILISAAILMVNVSARAQFGLDSSVGEMLKRVLNMVNAANEVNKAYKEVKDIAEKFDQFANLATDLYCLQQDWELYEKSLNISQDNCLYSFEKKIIITKMDYTLTIMDGVSGLLLSSSEIVIGEDGNYEVEKDDISFLKIKSKWKELTEKFDESGITASQAQEGLGGYAQTVKKEIMSYLEVAIKELTETKNLIEEVNMQYHDKFLDGIEKRKTYEEIYYLESMDFNI